MRRIRHCASSFFYHPSASAAALSHHYILSLNYIFQEGVKRLRIFFHLLWNTDCTTASWYKVCFLSFLHSRSLLHTQPASGCTSVTEAANQPRRSVPIKSRGGEFICGAACCHVENNSRRMEKGRVRSSLYSKLSQAAEKKEIHFITWFHTTVFFPPSTWRKMKDPKPFSFLCLDPLKSPHHWNQVIVLLAQFLQPSDATDCNRLHL